MLETHIYMLFFQDQVCMQHLNFAISHILYLILPHQTPLQMMHLMAAEEEQGLGTDIEVLLLLSETSVDLSVSWMGPRETKYRQVMMSWPYKQGKSQITDLVLS